MTVIIIAALAAAAGAGFAGYTAGYRTGDTLADMFSPVSLLCFGAGLAVGVYVAKKGK